MGGRKGWGGSEGRREGGRDGEEVRVGGGRKGWGWSEGRRREEGMGRK